MMKKYSEHSFGPDVIASGRAKTIFGMGRRRKNFGWKFKRIKKKQQSEKPADTVRKIWIYIEAVDPKKTLLPSFSSTPEHVKPGHDDRKHVIFVVFVCCDVVCVCLSHYVGDLMSHENGWHR